MITFPNAKGFIFIFVFSRITAHVRVDSARNKVIMIEIATGKRAQQYQDISPDGSRRQESKFQSSAKLR